MLPAQRSCLNTLGRRQSKRPAVDLSTCSMPYHTIWLRANPMYQVCAAILFIQTIVHTCNIYPATTCNGPSNASQINYHTTPSNKCVCLALWEVIQGPTFPTEPEAYPRRSPPQNKGNPPHPTGHCEDSPPNQTASRPYLYPTYISWFSPSINTLQIMPVNE